jgi:hypothetical protein
MRRLILAVSIVAALGVSDARAVVTGNDLWNACRHGSTQPDSWTSGFCFGYIVGAHEGAMVAQEFRADAGAGDRPLCVPGNLVTREQIADLMTVYLRDHPAERHEPALVLVTRAIGTAFPC